MARVMTILDLLLIAAPAVATVVAWWWARWTTHRHK
jgi:hypothetical protein